MTVFSRDEYILTYPFSIENIAVCHCEERLLRRSNLHCYHGRLRAKRLASAKLALRLLNGTPRPANAETDFLTMKY
jgi:hypothetical protein